jgi:hypothetical protein
MKRLLLAVVILSIVIVNISADEHIDQIRRRAANHIATMSQVPLEVRVDTSPYSRQPRAFDIALLTWDDDAPYLFINDVQLTMAEANVETQTAYNVTTGQTEVTSISYTMEMMVVDPEIAQRDIPYIDWFIHEEGGGLYSTPAFRHISPQDVREAGSLENSKNIAQGFSGGLGMGFGGIGLACLITALIVDDFQGLILASGAVCFGIGGIGVYVCNMINNNLNRDLAEVYGRMAAAANGQS